MSNFRTICLIAIISLLTTAATKADMTVLVSGDASIAYALTDRFGPEDGGNKTFFSNVLQGGSKVVLLDDYVNAYTVSDIKTYYNTLSGVSASTFTGEVTSAKLGGADLFVASLPYGDFTSSEITVMADFLAGGGDIFFLGDNYAFPTHNATINNALAALGSSLSIDDTRAYDNDFHTATGAQIASDTYTTGVSTFTYASVSLVNGGTTLFYTTRGKPFMAYEMCGVVPVPGAVLLGMIGLGLAGVKLRKHA
jgi:hypothetical protein